MRLPLIGLSLGLLASSLAVPSARAQNHAGPVFAPAGRSAPVISRGGGIPRDGFLPPVSRFAHNLRRHHFRPYYPYYASYWPYFYSPDYDYDEGPREEPPPPARAAVQAAAPSVSAETPKAAESVVMELRGGRWVRLTSMGPVEVGRTFTPTSAADNAQPVVLPAFDSSPAATPLPAAVLVFRDGHQEEISQYTIVGKTIYLKADYYSSGSWSRKISVADLDLPSTLKRNNERGTKFALPSRASEIILRP